MYIIFFISDRIARSMPNLNKIRGQKKNSAGPPAGSKTGLGRGQHNYGLSSRHHNSDPRMVPGHPGNRQVQTGYNQQQNQGVPSRGTVLSRDVRFLPRVNVQGVKSLGSHFECLCRVFEFYGVKKYYFSVRKWQYFRSSKHFYTDKT